MPDTSQPLADHRVRVVEDESLIAHESEAVDLKRWLTAAGATVIGPVPSVDPAFDLIEDVF